MVVITRFSWHEKMMIFSALFAVIAHPNLISANDSLYPQITQPAVRTQEVALAKEFLKLPVCKLNLILKGTISGNSPKALISVDGRDDELFLIDQTITNDVVLVNVGLLNVVVHHNGELEKLKLVSAGLYAREPADIDSIPSVIVAVSPSAPAGTINNSVPPDSNLSQNYGFPNKKHSYMGIQFEYSDFLTQAKLTPDPTGGLIISESVPGGLYERFGLQDGDNVRTINDESVNSVHDLVDVFQKKNGTDTINILIMRNGNLYDLELDPKHGIESSMVIDPKKLD